MKALSVKQPWAWLICAGYKDIENRNWRIGRKLQHGIYSTYHQANFTIDLPCRIYVHAGKHYDYKFDEIWTDFPFTAEIMDELDVLFQNPETNPELYGAIIGEVDILDCVIQSESPWFIGKYGFVLANSTLYETPIPCRGQLGFFQPDIEGVV